MPFLGGIFGKKNKSSARSNSGASHGPASIAPSDLESALSSPTNSYVTTEKHLPSSPNGKNSLSSEGAYIGPSQVYPSIAHGNASASSSRLRLPFGRKKQKHPAADASSTLSTSPNRSFLPPPRPSYAAHSSTGAASDTDVADTQRLRPPPSKSAIFAAYADPNSALSSRSLPDEPMHSWSSMHSPLVSSKPPAPKEKERRPSLFAWTKSSSSTGITKSSPPEQSRSPQLMSLDSPPRLDSDSSFNLKSFRHVRPPSPSASSSSLVVPPPRPRGASVNSDSSQRISVAAFREAQARRSTAGSPVPSFRSPSPSLPPPGFPQDGQRGRASPRPSPAVNQPHSSPHSRSGAYHQRRRSANIAVGFTSESEESITTSEDEESDEEDADGSRNTRVHRDGTITPRTRPLIGRQAKSEIGHGSTSYDSPTTTSPRPPLSFLATRSQSGHGQADENVRKNSVLASSQKLPANPPPPHLNSNLDMYGGAPRPRASASASALSPSAAAKRASTLASANTDPNLDSLAGIKQATRHVRDSSTYSNPSPSQPKPNPADSDTSDSESGSDSDSDNAPLASLVPPRRPGSALSQSSNVSLRTNGTRGTAGRVVPKPLIDINELTKKKPSVGAYKSNDDGFTKGGLLASHLSSSEGPSMLVESPTSVGFPSSPLSGSSSSAVLTSKTPPSFTKFVPPTSPSKEVQAFAGLDMRPSAVPSRPQPRPVQQSNTKEKESSPERRRDIVTERLAKLTKGKGKEDIDISIGLGPGGVIGSTSSSLPQQQRTTSTQPELSSKRSTTKLSIPQSGVRSEPSPPDDDLIQDVDDSILRLISRMGDSDVDAPLSLPPKTTATGGEKDEDSVTDSESDTYGEPERNKSFKNENGSRVETSRFEMPKLPSLEKDRTRIAPIPIRQREPQSSFSVISRPPVQKASEDDVRSTFTAASSNTNAPASTRFNTSSTRSSMAVDTPNPISDFKSNSTLNSSLSPTSSTSNFATARKRSSTLIPSSTTSPVPVSSSSSSSTFAVSTSSFAKLNTSSRGGSSVASSSNASSTGASSPKMSSANADRASALKTIANGGNGLGARSAAPVAQSARPRSSTMVPMISKASSSQNKITSPAPGPSIPPVKPFAVRRDSPASSTGGSSSGRAPLTPRDGSDIGSSRTTPSSKKEKKDEWSSGVSGLGVTSNRGGMHSRAGSSGPGVGRHVQRRSVSFDDDVGYEEGKKGKVDGSEDDAEARRKERRRSEAKAAIELGNVINGPGPIVSDDEDDLPINQAMNVKMSNMNPVMTMNAPMPMQMFNSAPGSPATWGGNLPLPAWPQQGGPPQMPQMLSPNQLMVPPPAGPGYMAAHHQAMMFAKQAYQMAVAQQAMAAAADEWDRQSVMGGSVYGGPSSNASVMMGPSSFNMMSGMGNGWSNGSVVFPNSTQSVYGGLGGISSSRSDYGGGADSVSSMANGRWSSARSTYGESFGPSDRLRPSGGGGTGNRNSGMVRDSGYYPPMPPIPQSHSGGSSSSGARGRGRTTSGPANPSRGGMKKLPPSSWKAGA
ncbi:hypothetical protein D9756_006142 [Leucocoprinus leucothites]|uniref:Uncharacterized protein n=1 Tax=Leucocoprinus leucothites TaxID=201217 RepID=A0A8H5D410_9AGAR|nr:hypothetical protein D9756_006142 [Leucoagaricus leucothites]